MVVSWNVHVGGGRIEELVEWIRADKVWSQPDVGIVLLFQEAFRSGTAVPFPVSADAPVPKAIRKGRPTPDVMALARKLGMSAVYVPSMRNGPGVADDREDRGNAILSTEPLTELTAIELPFGKQRRVAVMATVGPVGSAGRFVRVVSQHFDTSGHRAIQSAALADQLRALKSEGIPLISAGDLNALGGTRDDAFRALAAVLPVEACGTGRTNTWPLRLDVPFGWWRGRIDFMFSSLDTFGFKRTCRTLPTRYESDHHPVLMDLSLGVTAPTASALDTSRPRLASFARP